MTLMTGFRIRVSDSVPNPDGSRYSYRKDKMAIEIGKVKQFHNIFFVFKTMGIVLIQLKTWIWILMQFFATKSTYLPCLVDRHHVDAGPDPDRHPHI